jgi:hypothetical protein
MTVLNVFWWRERTWWRRSISTHRISRAMSVRRLLGWIIGQVMGMLRIPLGECHSLLARDQPLHWAS